MAKDWKEYRLQRAMSDYLKGIRRKGNKEYPATVPFRDLLWFAVGNQRQDETEAYLLKQIGVKAGVYDLIFIKPLMAGDAKVDSPLSSNQKKFREAFQRAGGTCFEWRSVRQMRDDLIAAGLVCHNMTVFEPDYRTQAEKHQQAHDLYRPSIQPDTPSTSGEPPTGNGMVF